MTLNGVSRPALILFAVTLVAVAGASFFIGLHSTVTGVASAVGAHTAGASSSASAKSASPSTIGRLPSSAPTSQDSPRLPLPPANMPLKERFAALQERATAGDAAATVRLFRDLSRCAGASRKEWSTANTIELLTPPVPQATAADVLPSYQAQLDAAQKKLEANTQLKALCDGATSDMLSQLTPMMLQAAQQGDPVARNCYVNRGPLIDYPSAIAHPELIAAYPQNAPSLIEAGLAAGDWKMVNMLEYAYGPSGSNVLAGLTGPDPEQWYRYLKLSRLGMTDNESAWIDSQIALAANGLSNDQRMHADDWAQTQYQQNFQGNPMGATAATPGGWNACEIPTE